MQEFGTGPSLTFLHNVLHQNLSELKDEYKKAKRKAFWMKLITIIIASSIPVIIGLDYWFSANLALILGGISTALISIDQYLRVTTSDREIHALLKQVQKLAFDIDLFAKGNDTIDDVTLNNFSARFNDIFNYSLEQGIEEHKDPKGIKGNSYN